MAIWMDLTFSIKKFAGYGIVGIVRAELELAHKLYGIDSGIRFYVIENDGFYELKGEDINWLINSDNPSESYMKKWPIKKETVSNNANNDDIPSGLAHAYNIFGRYTRRAERLEYILQILILKTPFVMRWISKLFLGGLIKLIGLLVSIVDRANGVEGAVDSKDKNKRQTVDKHPFEKTDILLACGLCADGMVNREFAYSELKNKMPEMKVIYMIYDLVFVNPETAALYSEKQSFEKYLFWISNNCDYVCYGGKTAQKDSERYWKEHGCRIPDGEAIKFGSNAFSGNAIPFDVVKKKYHIEDKYILAVGSVDAKKNYDVIYKALSVIISQNGAKNCPQLVIAGGSFGRKRILEYIEFTPIVKDKICVIRPTDEELNALYDNCLFSVLPTWYEGWSLTLPEALNHGKLCVASDVPPLKEIGNDLIEYADPADPYEWGNCIYKLSNDLKLVSRYEDKIRSKWNNTTWEDAANMVYGAIQRCADLKNEGKHLIFDMTLIYQSALINAPCSGILRTELILLRYLCQIYPSMRLLAFCDDGAKYLNRYSVRSLLCNDLIDKGYQELRQCLEECGYYNSQKANKMQMDEDLYWLTCSVLPKALRRRIIQKNKRKDCGEERENILTLPFDDGDIFLSFGCGYANVKFNVAESLSKANRKHNYKYIQILYDFTPVLFPQLHNKYTRESYNEFLNTTFENADFILYGGKTAENDGKKYVVDNKLPALPSAPIYFGGNKVGVDPNEKWNSNEEEEEQLFKKLGIKGKFVLVVGSIEPRKNHESLYLAYLHMLKKFDDLPQMIFAGFYGWDMEEFVSRVQRDERVRQKIIFYTPSDKELDLLYRKCMFTVLASLYEGWSLTLPESLSRGKFCLCCDTPALKEIAGDLSDYVEGFDIKTWAEKIHYYYENEDALKAKEKAIKDNWHVITWRECAEQVASIIDEQMDA